MRNKEINLLKECYKKINKVKVKLQNITTKE